MSDQPTRLPSSSIPAMPKGVPLRDPEFSDFWRSLGYPIQPTFVDSERIGTGELVVYMEVDRVGAIHTLDSDEIHWLNRGIVAKSVLDAFAKWFHSQPPST